MNWNDLNDIHQLDSIVEESKNIKILIYKHSTRCGICDVVKDRLERSWKKDLDQELKPYLLDLLAHRNISNEISKRYNVVHESPQVLVISNGNCIYSDSQMGIRLDELLRGSNVKT